jgi:hypothetical protein
MSHHDAAKHPRYNTPEIHAALRKHGLSTDKPSQLSDSFRHGFLAALSQPSPAVRDVNHKINSRHAARLLEELVEKVRRHGYEDGYDAGQRAAPQPTGQPSPAVSNSEMWRHKKSGGIYAWVMTVVREEDQKVLVVYRGVNDGVRWARPADEFYDGRFERIDADDQPTEPAQPATQAGAGERGAAFREASSLATALFKKHFAHEPDYASGAVVWRLCDTTRGIISQIDNMVSGLVRPTTEQPGDAEMVELIVRDCCETDPADPDRPETICIHVDHLRAILQSQLDAARAAHGKGGQG